MYSGLEAAILEGYGHCDVCVHKHIPARGSEGMRLFLRQSLDANVARILSLVLQTQET